VARTLIDINEALLSTAAKELGTTTKRATVEAALRAVVGKAARRELGQLMADGGKSPGDLDAEQDAAWH
jgi:Arc/MetJ family transcription regulator